MCDKKYCKNCVYNHSGPHGYYCAVSIEHFIVKVLGLKELPDTFDEFRKLLFKFNDIFEFGVYSKKDGGGYVVSQQIGEYNYLHNDNIENLKLYLGYPSYFDPITDKKPKMCIYPDMFVFNSNNDCVMFRISLMGKLRTTIEKIIKGVKSFVSKK